MTLILLLFTFASFLFLTILGCPPPFMYAFLFFFLLSLHSIRLSQIGRVVSFLQVSGITTPGFQTCLNFSFTEFLHSKIFDFPLLPPSSPLMCFPFSTPFLLPSHKGGRSKAFPQMTSQLVLGEFKLCRTKKYTGLTHLERIRLPRKKEKWFPSAGKESWSRMTWD